MGWEPDPLMDVAHYGFHCNGRSSDRRASFRLCDQPPTWRRRDGAFLALQLRCDECLLEELNES